MTNRLIPFGYNAPNAAQRLTALMDDDPERWIIDIRKQPWSHDERWRKDALRATWGMRYQWLGAWLGNVNYNNDGPIRLVDERGGLARLENILKHRSVVMLCACKDYWTCHRHTVVDLLRVSMPDAEIVLEEVQSGHRDVVVTVPKSFGLDRWIDEGDPAGSEWSGKEWHFYLGGNPPDIKSTELVYVVYNGVLRGYAPLVRIDRTPFGYGLVRHGDAVAVTIPEHIPGFRGFKYRWWDRSLEAPFPDWHNPDAKLPASDLSNALDIIQVVGKSIEAKAQKKVPVDYWTNKDRDADAKAKIISTLNSKY